MRETLKGSNMFKTIIGGLILSACSFSLGYGYSQQSIGNLARGTAMEISHTAIEISDLKKRDEQLLNSIANVRDNFDIRIKIMADLTSEQIKQTTQLIAILQAQNTLLHQQLKN